MAHAPRSSTGPRTSATTAPVGGPTRNVRTAVVWEVLSAVLAERAVTDGAPLEIVDAGGGSGGFAVPLAEAGHGVTVVEPSPDALAALARRAAERGVADRVTGVQGDLSDLPRLVAGQADLLLCHSVLEMVDDPAAALRDAAASLRAGGRLSLLVANRDAAVVARAVAGHPDEAARVLTDPAGRWGSGDGTARRFTPAQVVELVEETGLVVEQVHGVRVVADLVPRSVAEAEPGGAAALLALERALADRPPFRDLATQIHVLAVRS